MSKKIKLEFTYTELHALQVALANHFDFDADIFSLQRQGCEDMPK